MSAGSGREWRRPTGDDDRPLQLAQVIWLHAAHLPYGSGRTGEMQLVRLARNDPSVLRHAIALGRSDDTTASDQARFTRAEARLEGAIALLAPSEDATGGT